MNKWKDTARASKEIVKQYKSGKVVFAENTLFVIEKEISDELYLVLDTNPKKAERGQYKLKAEEINIEDYDITRDINIQMLLADGWDAQDLLKLVNK